MVMTIKPMQTETELCSTNNQFVFYIPGCMHQHVTNDVFDLTDSVLVLVLDWSQKQE